MYEVNANGNRSYTSPSAAKVARVAAAWAKQGHHPHAYAAYDDGHGRVATTRVPVTTAAETAKRLVAAAK